MRCSILEFIRRVLKHCCLAYYDFNGPIEDPSQLAGENVTFSRLMKRACACSCTRTIVHTT